MSVLAAGVEQDELERVILWESYTNDFTSFGFVTFDNALHLPCAGGASLLDYAYRLNGRVFAMWWEIRKEAGLDMRLWQCVVKQFPTELAQSNLKGNFVDELTRYITMDRSVARTREDGREQVRAMAFLRRFVL